MPDNTNRVPNEAECTVSPEPIPFIAMNSFQLAGWVKLPPGPRGHEIPKNLRNFLSSAA
jgi:hypothetical protein